MTEGAKVQPGRPVRKSVPRHTHAVWNLRTPQDRDPVAILQAQATTRVKELVPIRYGRMLASSFSFYRGAAAIMAADLAQTPTTQLHAQLCGDAHLANFGGFSAPDRVLVFDVNDFDETLPGPFEWDIKRLAASFAIAGRSRAFSPGQRSSMVSEVVKSYQSAMQEFATMSRLDVWYARLAAEDAVKRWGAMVDASTAARIRKNVEKAGSRNSAQAFSRYSKIDADGNLRPVSQPPLLVPLGELFEGEMLKLAIDSVNEALRAYMESLPDDRKVLVGGYEVVGVSRKVVGVGSVGTRCWIVLFAAKDDPLDDLVLQVKEAGPSVLEEYLGASAYGHGGQRVVEGQRLMQAASDTLLGWESTLTADGSRRDFYVRQMWDGKISADLAKLSLTGFQAYAGMCGWTLARAHARSGDRKAIAGYLGTGPAFADAMVAFAESYADQNEADFALVQQAAADGALPVEKE